MKALDLLAALARCDDRFEKAGPDLEHGFEAVAASEQRLAVLNLAQAGHHAAVDSLEFAFAQTGR